MTQDSGEIMVFILNDSKMDPRPDNIQNSMISLRGDYGTFSVQNFHKLVLFIFQHLNGIQYLGGEIMAPFTSRTSIYVGFDYFPTSTDIQSVSFTHIRYKSSELEMYRGECLHIVIFMAF